MKSLGHQMLSSFVFSLVVAGLFFVLQKVDLGRPVVHDQFWSIMVFSALLGFLVVAVANWGMKSFDAQMRPTVFIGITVMRLLLSMIFIGAAIFLGVEERVLWVVNFFAVYLLYLVFELYTILSNLRAISAEAKTQDEKKQ